MENQTIDEGVETQIQVYEGARSELSVADVKNQVQIVQQLMKDVMILDQHYGRIPGCGDKPVLLSAGADKLALLFRLAPTFQTERIDHEINGVLHREYIVKCTMRHMGTGNVVSEGQGSCSTLESKYRYRNAGRVCPECGADAIIKGKREYGGGWICFNKKGGCGAKFPDNHPVGAQGESKVDNPDVADQYNTVLKMATKRAKVAAAILAVAASDIFTQDIEEPGYGGGQFEQRGQQQPPHQQRREPEPRRDQPVNDQRVNYPNLPEGTCEVSIKLVELYSQGEASNGKYEQYRVVTDDGKQGWVFTRGGSSDRLDTANNVAGTGEVVEIAVSSNKKFGAVIDKITLLGEVLDDECPFD